MLINYDILLRTSEAKSTVTVKDFVSQDKRKNECVAV